MKLLPAARTRSPRQHCLITRSITVACQKVPARDKKCKYRPRRATSEPTRYSWRGTKLHIREEHSSASGSSSVEARRPPDMLPLFGGRGRIAGSRLVARDHPRDQRPEPRDPQNRFPHMEPPEPQTDHADDKLCMLLAVSRGPCSAARIALLPLPGPRRCWREHKSRSAPFFPPGTDWEYSGLKPSSVSLVSHTASPSLSTSIYFLLNRKPAPEARREDARQVSS